MPFFRSDKVLEIARDAKAFLSGKTEERREFKRIKSKIRDKKRSRRKRQELRRLRSELRATEGQGEKSGTEESEGRTRKEILDPEKELDVARERRVGGEESKTGSLPDFLIIGARKAGTTSLYNLLSRHPHVEPAVTKELHYFDVLFDEEDVEWYRRGFPEPKRKDGRWTITGEATPYSAHLRAPERAAKVVPEARLIALLRNPVDRAYSDYQQVARLGREPRTFEEAIGAKEGRSFAPENGGGLDDGCAYLSRGVYVDQLLRWSRFYPREQLLVLKSEDFFENILDTTQLVLDFLGQAAWKPEVAGSPRKRNKGKYGEMDPATRRRLEEYFEPHNRRLYDYLGVDFGW